MRIRKHQSDLASADFTKYPIWLSIRDTYTRKGDERKEDTRITMTPYTDVYDPTQPLLMDFNCMIAAELTLADGEIFPGYLKAKGPGMADIMHAQPVLFTETGQVDFYQVSSSRRMKTSRKSTLLSEKSQNKSSRCTTRATSFSVTGLNLSLEARP